MIKYLLKTFPELKTGFFCLLLSGMAFQLFSQEHDSIAPLKNPEKFLSKIRLPDPSVQGFNVLRDKFSGNWSGIDFGFNMMTNIDYTGFGNDFLKNQILKSHSLHINLIQKSFGLQSNRNTLGIVTGLGVQFQNFRLNKNTTFHRLENNRIEPELLIFDENQKSKFSAVWITAPLLLEHQVPVKHYKNRLYFSGGLFAGYRIGSNTNIVYRISRKREKLKTPDHFSLHNLRYGAMVRAGYRWLNIYAGYDLRQMFIKNLGPEVYPFEAGITLLRF
jgi:hypothetical protein